MEHKILEETLKGEAFAHIKYSLYADQAEKEGYLKIAREFRRIAAQELNEHFMEIASFYGLVKDTKSNLRQAMKCEKHEFTILYPQFAHEMEKLDHLDIADRYDELAQDEEKHYNVFASLEKTI